MAAFRRRNYKTRSQTNDNLLKLKAAGLDRDPDNLPKTQWIMDTDLWTLTLQLHIKYDLVIDKWLFKLMNRYYRY